VGDSSKIEPATAPAVNAPAPKRTKSLREIDEFILSLFACSAILALKAAQCKAICE
jgi:hypothetical protein